MDFFKGKADAAADHVKSTADSAKEAAGNTAIGQEMSALAAKIEAQAEAFKEEKKRMLEKWKEEKRALIMEFIQTKMEGIFDHGMNIAAESLKEKLKDPFMPNFVQGWVDDAVDAIWPDIKMELKDEVLKGFSKQNVIHHGEEACCGSCGPLAFFRYSLLPYDRGFWRQLRNPMWWLFTLASMVPKWGVMQIAYILQFFMIDKSDEFQLFQFIVMFKSLQFFTIGIVGSCIGSIQYYICVSKSPPTCDKESPRESFWTMVLFFLQVIVVFIAFLLLNCSEKKGGFYYQLEQQSRDEMTGTASREGRMNALQELAKEDSEMDETTRMTHALRYKSDSDMLENSKSRLVKFLIWDFSMFVLCVGLICFLAYYNLLDEDAQVNRSDDTINDGNWKFVMSLFWVKTFYGYMSFPFLLLKMPLISTLISHARPTGYNPYGNCVPFLGKEEEGPVPWDPERRPEPETIQA